ncbi:MAG: ParB/RepB/Spo0J family partition protein [Lachnospiraceae bacterium]|nr:ParB/RepB/Spo0J family partition protein [Lachnospiraceae bacterium]
MAVKKRGGLGKGLDSLIPGKPLGNENANTAGAAASGSAKDGNELVRMIRISKIEPDREQPRRNFKKEELEELAASIKNNGLLEPIIVQEEENRFLIIAGERRWRASQMAGLTEIPAIVKHYTRQERVEISLIENIQREDLNPIEEANAYKRLAEEFGLKQEEIAEKVSRSRTAVTNAMRLLKLSDKVQQMIVDGSLSMGHARALIPVESTKLQEELADRIVRENLSVREVEKLIKDLSKKKKTPSGSKQRDASLEIIYRDLAREINQALGMKVGIKGKEDGSGKLEIEFSNSDELEDLMSKLIE